MSFCNRKHSCGNVDLLVICQNKAIPIHWKSSKAKFGHAAPFMRLSLSIKSSSSPDSVIYFHKDDIICVVGFLFIYFFIFELPPGSGSRGSRKILEDSLGMLLGARGEDSVLVAILRRASYTYRNILNY